MSFRSRLFVLAALAAICLVVPVLSLANEAPAEPDSAPPTVEEAQAFVDQSEKRLLELVNKLGRASWVKANFITDDTEQIEADFQNEYTALGVELATKAARFNSLKLPYDVERKLNLIKLGLTLPAPNNAAERKELTEIAVGLDGDYGKGKYCRKEGGVEKCSSLNDLERTINTSRNYDELLEAWKGWHNTPMAFSPPDRNMRERYVRQAALANKGARELGFKDLGAMWRSNYDMPPDEFAREVDRLWEQVKPLYLALHTHVRASLVQHYGKERVSEGGAIPAHLLGNMWAQEWGNIYPIVAAPPGAKTYDLGELLKQKKVDEREMVRYGERFFTSLGFESLPETFWKRSLFTKPADRDVICHASAWDVDNDQDLRIKMCIEIRGEDFITVHHELGHNFYQRAYRTKPYLYRGSANDGFHEAVGDAVALSITPEYLRKVGLLENVPDPSGDLALLMRQALDKIAFLPFGLLVDQWRWKVFSGEVKPENYNQAWWDLRLKYQGIKPPVERSEKDFDPGAKYHVPGNVPYTRYFLARILQFQFHRALCREAGFTGPLHRCSIYGNKRAGEKLNQMLELGASRPWPEALEVITGERQTDATAILDYFAPLKKWLDEQNKGRKVGW
ncbi:MAG: M2 family metallopeptidase [Acidobacteria bacterium]|nr:M2 family metallopeptidase [Acidobacteriota bacterium]